MGKTSATVKNRYRDKVYDQINITVKKESSINKESIQAAADTAGESLNGYVTKAIQQRMERDKQDN